MDAEVTQPHTRLMKLTLAVEDSRAYWTHIRPEMDRSRAVLSAFEGRWFGDKRMPRIREIMADFRNRYDAFPQALTVLRRWRPADPNFRQIICHWHLQLADPLYRDFTGPFLDARRRHPAPNIHPDAGVRWLRERIGDRWAVSTVRKVARNLITAATEAGLCEPGRHPRPLTYPPVPDTALAYLLYLFRRTTFSGTLLDNPYLASVGLAGGSLETRLRRLPGLTFGRMGDLVSFEWRYPDLEAWADNTLDGTF